MYIFNTLIISADPCRCHCRGRRPRQRSIGSGLFLLHWQAVQELAAPRPSGPSRSLPSTAMLLERGEGCFFPGCSFLYIYRSIDRSIYRSIDRSIDPSIDLSIYPSIHQSIHTYTLNLFLYSVTMLLSFHCHAPDKGGSAAPGR